MKKWPSFLLKSVIIIFGLDCSSLLAQNQFSGKILDTLCRDTSICIQGDPFNLNLLCFPTGGVYFGSSAVIGDQFNPIIAKVGINKVSHGFVIGKDTIKACSFNVIAYDTVYDAGDIMGSNNVCRETYETYNVSPISNATNYLWSFSGSNFNSYLTNGPSITLFFSNLLNSGYLTVQGKNEFCKKPGTVSSKFNINVNLKPIVSIENLDNPIEVIDTLCKNTRSHYYVVEANENYQWSISHGKIIGDSSSRKITVDWGDIAGNGSITATVEDQKQCYGFSNRQVIITNDSAPGVSIIWLFGHNMLVCSDSIVSAYQWYNDRTLIPGATDRYLLADTNNPNCYYVQTCRDACCNWSDPFCFYGQAAIKVMPGRKVTVYPNPVNDMISITLIPPNSRKIFVGVYNQYGLKVYEFELIGGKSNLNFSWLPSGLYYLKSKDETEYFNTFKVIKF
ncbi:MAG: T9SS type A sorting domain-containing protein [Bacteroidota bacterium]